MTRITTTFWDCGGVLLTNGWDHNARKQVTGQFALDFAEFEKRHERVDDSWERGNITIDEYLQETVFYMPQNFSQQDFIASMKSVSRVLYPEMTEFVQRLRVQANYRLYLLSNESRELMQYRIGTYKLASLFDGFLISPYIRLRKPEPAFFRCALDIVQRAPEECVFIDDREENVEAARAFGIHGVQMQSPQQAIAELNRLGISTA